MCESGIYKITNTARNKVYVGSAVDLYQRRHNHFSRLKLQTHHNAKLQNAWNKYGAEAFVFEVLEIVDKYLLTAREQHWMDALNSVADGYNIFPRARSSIGTKMSDIAKRKISAARKGKPLSAAHVEAMRKSAARNRVRSADETAKRAASATGKKHSEATKQKLREAAKGRTVSGNAREKISAKLKGRKQPEATRRALAKAHTGAVRSDVAREKMSAAQKLRFKTTSPSRDRNGRLIKT